MDLLVGELQRVADVGEFLGIWRSRSSIDAFASSALPYCAESGQLLRNGDEEHAEYRDRRERAWDPPRRVDSVPTDSTACDRGHMIAAPQIAVSLA